MNECGTIHSSYVHEYHFSQCFAIKIKYRNKRDTLGKIKLQLSSITPDRIVASIQTATLALVFGFILSNCYARDFQMLAFVYFTYCGISQFHLKNKKTVFWF